MINRNFGIALISLLAMGSAQAAPLALHRGIGVHDWLNWAPVDAAGNYRQPPYNTMTEWLSGYRPLSDWPAKDQFARMKDFGFDFVRLSVDPGPLLEDDGAHRAAALAVLDEAVRHIVGAGLHVVFNLHMNSQVDAYSQETTEQGAASKPVARYNAMVVDVAKMLTAIGTDTTAIEPYNEPHYYPCDTDDWQRIQTAQVQMIRAVSPDITIVATGACGGDIEDLLGLDATAFDDPNILYSFHMYDPHSFTHQRLDNGGFASGLPWPASARSRKAVEAALTARMDAAGVSAAEQQANWQQLSADVDNFYAQDWNKAAMAELFARGVDWAKGQGIPADRLFMGEFGVIEINAKGDAGALPEDRNRYIADARSLAEQYGIAWAYWEYANPYGMTFIAPAGPAVPDASLLAPLGLPPQAQ